MRGINHGTISWLECSVIIVYFRINSVPIAKQGNKPVMDASLKIFAKEDKEYEDGTRPDYAGLDFKKKAAEFIKEKWDMITEIEGQGY